MAQVSNIGSDFSSGDQDGDRSEEGKKKSLLSTVKEKAKGTARKIKSKVKKGSGEPEYRSSGLSSGGQDSDDEVESSLDSQSPASKLDTQSPTPDHVPKNHNGSEPREAFGGNTEDGMLNSFARSGTSGNAPLVAVPTSYGEPNTTVDAVMPPAIIEPSPVSDLGEESSTNLGEIPEAKDEEKTAAKEVLKGGPESDIDPGFKDTFKQKDLQAIDGLPKPQGFDIDNQSSVKSNDFRFSRSGDFSFSRSGDLSDQLQTPLQETDPNADNLSKGGEREFPSGGSMSHRIEDNEKPHPPGSVAGFHDGMFSSNVLHGLKPNDPSPAEAQQAGVIGTLSRGYDPDTNQTKGSDGKAESVQNPPGSVAEFHDGMFSSSVLHGLKPNESSPVEAQQASVIGTSSHGYEPETDQPKGSDGPTSTQSSSGDLPRDDKLEDNLTFQEAPRDLPPPALELGATEDNRKDDGSSAERGASAPQKLPISDEQEAENYFDALSEDEVVASQKSLGSDSSSQAPAQDNRSAGLTSTDKVSTLLSKAFGALTGVQQGESTKTTEDNDAPPPFMQ